MFENLKEKSVMQVLNFIALLLPLLGVVFLGWSAFDMVFIYLTQATVLSYFGMKKQELIWKHRKRTYEPGEPENLKQGSVIWIFVLFGFFYILFRGVLLLTNAINHPEVLNESRHEGERSFVVNYMLGPVLDNPQILVIMILNFISGLADYLRYEKRKEYSEPADKEPNKIVETQAKMVGKIYAVSFFGFWLITVLGHFLGFNSERFVQIILAFVMLGVWNEKEITRYLKGE